MGYSPKFQKLLKEVTDLSKESIEKAQKAFFDGCVDLGRDERLINLYRVKSKRKQGKNKDRMVFFLPNKLQRTILREMTNRNLVLKMRQGGVTTLARVIALDGILFEQGYQACIIAHVQPNVKKIFRELKKSFQSFQQDWGTFYPVTNNRDNVSELGVTEMKSEVSVATETKGLTLDFLHITEAAFVPKARISESVDSVPLTGLVILETTPDTAAGMFYELWESYFNNKQDSYKGIFLPWWLQYPESEDIETLRPKKPLSYSTEEELLMKTHTLKDYHIVFRRIKISEAGNDLGEFLRKYPEDPLLCFLGGASGVFPGKALLSLQKSQYTPAFTGRLEAEQIGAKARGKIKFESENCTNIAEFRGVKIWNMPQPTKQYAIGADVAEGVGRDASCAKVVEVETGSEVASFWSDVVDTDTFAAELWKLGKFYNTAWMCVEANNHGHSVITNLTGSLDGLCYPNLYKRFQYDQFTHKKTKIVGFRTNSQTKPRMISNLKAGMRDGAFRTYDQESISEYSNFIKDEKGRMGAKGSGRDDRVIASALAWEQVLHARQNQNYGNLNTEHEIEYDPITGFPI